MQNTAVTTLTGARETQITAALDTPTNCARRHQVALALQRNPAPLPDIADIADFVLLPLLPDKGASAAHALPAATTSRHGLTAAHVVTREAGNRAVVTFQLPTPQSISRVEGVLWPDLGVACVRGVYFLLQWHTLRYWKPAAAAAHVTKGEIDLMCEASPTFKALHDAFRSNIMAGRHAEAEDTLHALANGDLRKIKETTNPDGSVITVDEGAIYDSKALALELQAGDRKRYGATQSGGSGIAVNIMLDMPRPLEAAPRVTVVTATDATDTPEDVEYVEA